MSPRRRLPPAGEPRPDAAALPRPRRWPFPLALTIATALAAAAITLCADVAHSHDAQRRSTLHDLQALDYVRTFMTEFTSPDPFHANDYTDRVLAHATGAFAEQYRNNQNQILGQVARSEPTTGTVIDAAVSRGNDDGSVDVLVVTKFTAKSADGTLQLERANRWVVTTKQEGDRWKISNVIPVS